MSEIGVNVTVDRVESAVYYENLAKGTLAADVSYLESATAEPDNNLRLKLHSTSIGNLNYSHYANPAFDAMVDKAGRPHRSGRSRCRIYRAAKFHQG
jgi:ABC-type oligopeptide transport system substrate-binding subunit